MSPAFSEITRSPRLHGLDALRGFAAVLVVMLHAGIPYMITPLSHLPWPARDGHPSVVVDGMTWCTAGFLMPLFFVLAGFFSEGLLVSHGAREFLRERTKRLLWTQLAASVLILPLCFYLWALGFAADGLYLPTGYLLPGLPLQLKAELFGTAHLWFLQNLYIYSLILWGASCLTTRSRLFAAFASDSGILAVVPSAGHSAVDLEAVVASDSLRRHSVLGSQSGARVLPDLSPGLLQAAVLRRVFLCRCGSV